MTDHRSVGASRGPSSRWAGSGLTRRGFLAGAGGLFLLGAAGCGGAGDSGDQGSSASGAGRTIEHKYGTTRITGTPERVVSVGFTDQDAILAFGVVPLAMGRWIENKAVWPWNRDELDGEQPEIITPGEPDFEQVAALNPDLIVGLSSGMTRETYDTLSEIAPTIDHADEYVDFGTPWQEVTRVVGRALNQQDRPEELVSGIEAGFEEAREQHPEFQGKTVALALPGEEAGTYYPWSSQDGRVRFMTSLGFETSPETDRLAGDNFYATISGERLDLLDQDLLIWLIQTDEQEKTIKESELYQQLDVVRRGQDVFFRLSDEEPIVAAFSYGTVLSLPYLLENLVPRIAAAIDSDRGKQTTRKEET
jgi:iron complex transport system substrate-binding protein